ncbi:MULTISPECIES: iron-siderophore ABC transporter substrate-binding protein [unclassified Streptomyces]|uniref:iron-siderophore ABC transporter substrate-binding protein n=1 Tax=unclassified Streptomyces TaxID=2593676 RepID=UPI002E7FEA76|nr:iron-siderophore ABC transporter substrate-binding protein [Streptomyces sp. NBC_00589]WTI36670.1 iron-siderophore ABC transporter substrate-binding protein [Streptomyces sp. NBC_00775]WUB29653.1 iron-siderophore ABC transporter substrate-binding protein [Streptomyces sp. NBC_00589]
MRALRWKAVLAVSVVGGMVVGCSAGADNDAKEASGGGSRNLVAGASEGPSAAPSALSKGMGADTDADGKFPRTVGHFAGSTEVKAAPKRIAVLSTGQLDDLLSLGVVPAATTRADNAGLVPDYLQDAFPTYKKALAKMTDAGTRTAPNLESLAAAKPDLILANDSLGDLYPKLKKIAPTVITAGNGINWKRDLLLVGDAIGKGGQAREMLDDITGDAAEQGRSLGDPTVSMVRFTPGRTRMFGVSSFTGSLAVDMGLGRPTSQRFKAISQDIGPESIDVADGDWIFYSVQGDASRTDAGSVLAGPLWKSMKAVKAGHAVKVDDDPWYLNAGPTAARLVIKQLADTLST